MIFPWMVIAKIWHNATTSLTNSYVRSSNGLGPEMKMHIALSIQPTAPSCQETPAHYP